ncbi:2Fe-2S iron-sulfur cluster binding domain-containing protein [Haloferax mediterranei ATCC 33500]|uniref:2Fe-2S iron-sulfur cluster binding domain-containing protein n=1 Tax=Haloferax mediterranei (strain ATCC 33500 / DSM 1411 / JCM 8866 / NBRC 14739 / NCIMB 2177 / R-4) TaxID=523841 RepID=I3R5N4_HALMT|nr:ferredoxin Fer [Haloferax mediterranei]AFK19544.1 ferredoxin [Haloferax mediterranei ATCC 33500]AHZ22938.1 ferredoxin [Haloferax mediterranei ATCC 33500]ELZ99864.1 ferredoxin [Haloferax mediterranei ATCC 33500]MDX5987713.1 ferredoxin Fer [Haloferax mediterranei ATCC 33500]QCQ74197.1 2Fe-2S iron-sulfur cluster binding domain-containing protein [Haloferax mediterranei ATCC 33500]
MDTPFEILRLDPDADEDELVDAYRRRVKEAHPDHGGSADEFQLVRAAYEAIRAGYEPGDGAVELVDKGGRGVNIDRETDAAREANTEQDAAEDTEPDRPGTRVEYLDYDVLDEHGWSLTDEDLFEKAAAEGLSTDVYGEVFVEPRTCLLKAAENDGHSWPYACRGGACANCAVAVVEGDMEMPADHILSEEMMDHGIRLSCISLPTTDEVKVVYNIEHLPGLDELRLPPQHVRKVRPND